MGAYDKLMKHTLVSVIIFAVLVLSAVFYYLSIRNTGQSADTGKNAEGMQREQDTLNELAILPGAAGQVYLCIPYPDNVEENGIQFKNNYMDRKLYVDIEGVPAGFYNENAVYGNNGYTESVFCRSTGTGVRLELELKQLYEYEFLIKNNVLFLKFVPPKEVHDKLIVLDAAGSDEVSLAVLKKVKEKLDKTDITVYCTRLDSSDPSPEQRVRLANDSKADMLISIAVKNDESNPDTQGTATVYNSTFFIPDFNSVDLADIMEKSVTEETRGMINGLKASNGNYTLVDQAAVPVALIELGYLSNQQERGRLLDPDYQEKASMGIVRGIQRAYDFLENNSRGE